VRTGKDAVAAVSPPRVRPRFGAHWGRVAVIVVWAAAFLWGVYVLWPADVPEGLYLLLLFPVIAGPGIALLPGLRIRMWPWTVAAIPFTFAAMLVATAADTDGLALLCGVLTGLAVGGVGLAATPLVVRRGRELDRLVCRESLGYQIFNVPGAGIGEAADRETARISARHLERVAEADAVRIVHSLTPPPLPGHSGAPGYVDHAVLRGNRLALVMARRWPAVSYAWDGKGVLTADGRRFPEGETGIGIAVKSFRKALPRGVRIRGFVALLHDDRPGIPQPSFTAHGKDDLFAGTVTQVSLELEAWLDATAPVVRRRTFAALLPHVRRL
jgi:hypothetical protein